MVYSPKLNQLIENYLASFEPQAKPAAQDKLLLSQGEFSAAKANLTTPLSKPLIVILGPTASGKTALSLALAKKYHGEIISADSRQVYKHMDIGTAKIMPQKQEGIPHHLLDIVEPSEMFTLADYKRLAEANIESILHRKKLPILVGGTGLYLSAIIENYDLPKAPPESKLRAELEEMAEREGQEAVHLLLKELDPKAAEKIHPNNLRYVIRAIEIAKVQNSPKVDLKKPLQYNPLLLGVHWERAKLYERIEKRIDEQMKAGFLEEVKLLLAKGYDESYSALNTLGYSELIKHLRGEISLEEAIEEMKKHTRNYAKRQLTWFRRYKNVHWIQGENLEEVINNLNV